MLLIPHNISEFHVIIFYICTVVSLLVFGTMIYVLYQYRKMKRPVSINFHKHISAEILWTIIPFIILVVMVFPSIMLFYNDHGYKNSLEQRLLLHSSII